MILILGSIILSVFTVIPAKAGIHKYELFCSLYCSGTPSSMLRISTLVPDLRQPRNWLSLTVFTFAGVTEILFGIYIIGDGDGH